MIELQKAVVGASDLPSSKWQKLMQDVIDAGGSILYHDQSLLFGNTGGVGDMPYSSMVRGYDIIAIPNMLGSTGKKCLSDIIEFLTYYSAISQIVGVYAIQEHIFRAAFIQGNGIVPSPSDMATSGVYNIPTSFARVGHGQKSVDSKKLLCYPFSYMRIETPKGDEKELRYEDFIGAMQGTGVCKLKVMTDLNNHPSIVVAPINYKNSSTAYTANGVDMTDVVNVNLKEMVNYDEFPQVPFITDAYLTYLAGQVMDRYSSNTLYNKQRNENDELAAQMALVTGVSDNIMGNISASESTTNKGKSVEREWGYAADPLKAGVGVAGNVVDYGRRHLETEYYKNMLVDSANYMQADGPISWGQFAGTKPAHANANYFPGTNGGIFNYIKGLTNIDFKLTHVQLRDIVLERYDEYFKLYGYNEAGRTGVPYIFNFMNGVTGTDKQPHWETDTEGHQVHYVQTTDCHVNGIPLVFATYIENIFNSGYRFINGDALIRS